MPTLGAARTGTTTAATATDAPAAALAAAATTGLRARDKAGTRVGVLTLQSTPAGMKSGVSSPLEPLSSPAYRYSISIQYIDTISSWQNDCVKKDN